MESRFTHDQATSSDEKRPDDSSLPPPGFLTLESLVAEDAYQFIDDRNPVYKGLAPDPMPISLNQLDDQPSFRAFQLNASSVAVAHHDDPISSDSQSHFSKQLFVDPMYDSLYSSVERDPPPPKGNYLEPLHHVYCAANANPLEVHGASFKSLVAQGVDCVPNESKLVFKVRVYTLPERKYCLEFQRRSGNSMRFCHIYRTCLGDLVTMGLLCDDALSSVSPLPPLMSSRVAPFDSSKAADAVTSLRQMASSTYVDVVCEAVRALSDSSLQVILLQGGILEIFIKGMQSDSEDLRRCGVTGCANLVINQANACRELVRVGCVRRILETIQTEGADGGAKNYTPQLVREMARLLVNIRQELGREMLTASVSNEAQLAHEKMCHSNDAIVRQHADMLSDILRGSIDTQVH
jgi:hypothetical protein